MLPTNTHLLYAPNGNLFSGYNGKLYSGYYIKDAYTCITKVCATVIKDIPLRLVYAKMEKFFVFHEKTVGFT